MQSRQSRIAFALAGATAALLAAACSPEVGVIGGDAGAEFHNEAGAVLDEALTDLAQQPMLAYSGTVGLSNDGDAEMSLTVTQGGTVFGTGKLGIDEFEVLVVDGQYFAGAPAEWWLEYFGQEGVAFDPGGTQWTKTYRDYWFPPELLTPKSYERELRETLDEAGVMSAELPAPVDGGGGEVYEFKVGAGSVVVTADAPHRVVGVNWVEFPYGISGAGQGQIDGSVDDFWGGEMTWSVSTPGADDAAGLREEVGTRLASMGRVFDMTGTAYADVDDLTYDCSAGSCEYAGTVSLEPYAPFEGHPEGEEFLAILHVTVVGSGDTEWHCSATAIMPPEGTAPMSCSVGGSGTLYPHASGLALFTPDTAALTAAANTDLDEVDAAYAAR